MAVIGVSRSNDRHPANIVYNKAYLRYPIEVFAVNPRGGTLLGERVYTDIAEIPEKIDLAVIAVRADGVPDVLEQCIQNNVGGAAIISGGFAEAGRPDLQDRIVAIAREADFPFIGPNCLGLYLPTVVDTFFLPGERMVQPDPGNARHAAARWSRVPKPLCVPRACSTSPAQVRPVFLKSRRIPPSTPTR